jgi:hypothetical protein
MNTRYLSAAFVFSGLLFAAPAFAQTMQDKQKTQEGGAPFTGPAASPSMPIPAPTPTASSALRT